MEEANNSKYSNIKDIESLRAEIVLRRAICVERENEIMDKATYFKRHKLSVIWNEFKPSTSKKPSGLISYLKYFEEDLFPSVLGLKNVSQAPATKIVIRVAELILANYAAKGIFGLFSKKK